MLLARIGFHGKGSGLSAKGSGIMPHAGEEIGALKSKPYVFNPSFN